MATRKTETAKTKKPAAKPAKSVQKKKPGPAQEVIQVEAKPSARTCPLVLDGITSAEGFSPRDCLACDEFDCRFYAAEERSGALGSTFAADGDRDDGFGDDDDGLGGFYEETDADDDSDDYDDMR